jgi:enediyne biosynthesis protein E3
MRKRLLSISPIEVTTDRRRFRVDDRKKQERIEAVGISFLEGYHAAIECDSLLQLLEILKTVPLDYQGFAYEGAAMGLGLLDRLLPWRHKQYSQFLSMEWNLYPYLTHVGLGWALARIPGGMHRFAISLIRQQTISLDGAKPHSLLACLVLDGYGFHQSYFAWEKYVQGMVEPKSLPPECLPVFNQGVGRSLCFVLGMDAERIAHTILKFPKPRQADLWSGVGLATAYAGGLCAQSVEALKQHAKGDLPAFAQGVAFAAKARQCAHHIPEHTQLVCQVVWEQPVESVAGLTDSTSDDLPLTSMLSAYAAWRERIQQAFVSTVAYFSF